jgi:hypothetical protein
MSEPIVGVMDDPGDELLGGTGDEVLEDPGDEVLGGTPGEVRFDRSAGVTDDPLDAVDEVVDDPVSEVLIRGRASLFSDDTGDEVMDDTGDDDLSDPFIRDDDLSDPFIRDDDPRYDAGAFPDLMDIAAPETAFLPDDAGMPDDAGVPDWAWAPPLDSSVVAAGP